MYENAGGNLAYHVRIFRANAIKSFKKISFLLKSEETVPGFIPHHLVDLTPEQLQEYVGVYVLVKVENYDGPLLDNQVKVWMLDNELVMPV